ncbi:hypothetical protein DPEC_G00364390 [Dallia pectoralis]|nr:hypothetical protein DPEC_G00364390 [Dallia pectoralis]
MNELECTDAAGNPLSDGALIECLTKHRELISGPHVWSPRARAYVPFERLVHGKFARLKPSGPTVVHLLGKLLPVYCRLCLLSECHDRAKIAAQALLARLTVSKDLRDEVAQFEIRTLVYMIDNLSATLPSEWGEVCQSTDVSAETKIAVELLWCHLALVYAGNRKLLLCNLELFFARPQDSLNLCPSELRAALFVHGKHDPLSQRKDRCRRQQRISCSGKCPVLPLDSGPRAKRGTPRSRLQTATHQLYESRMSRLAGWGLSGYWTSSVTREPFTGFTNLNRSECDWKVFSGLEPWTRNGHVACSDGTNEMLRATGSCVVELANNVLLHVLHVNTVGNQKFSATIVSERLQGYAQMQSNTTKTKLLSRLRFVSDKKRLCSQHGYKNTRIEFSSNPSRSANYTSNAKHLLQPYFRGLFETIALSQGTCMVSTKPFTVSNENLTSYIYGVANPLTVVLCMKNTNKHFHTPFFFSSVNVSGVETKHQLFTSMSINSQRVRNVAEELPEALGKVAKLVEIHVHLNRLCCELAQERRGMLTSQEKICLVYLTETYFVNVRERSQPKYWPGYREAVRGAVVARYRSPLSPFQDKVLANYHLKNPEFIHLIPWLLDNPSTLHNNLIVAHLAYLKEEGKVNARAELLATVDNHLDRNPNCRRPHGVPCLEDSDFKDLGYSEQTLRLAISKSRCWLTMPAFSNARKRSDVQVLHETYLR